MFAIFAGARGRCHVVWLHGVLVVWFAAKYIRSTLEHAAAARFYLCLLRGFRFSSLCLAFLFSVHRLFVVVSFCRLSFCHLCVVISFCFPLLTYLLTYFLVFFSFPLFVDFSWFFICNIYIIIKINIYSIYFVCACARARARNAVKTRHKKRAAKKAAQVVTLNQSNQI